MKCFILIILFIFKYIMFAFSSDYAVELNKINDAIWVHTSYQNINGLKFPSNGLIIITSNGLLLIDTAWGENQTKELIKLASDKFKQSIKLAIITHSHDDRIGGIGTLLDNGVKVISTKQTAEKAEKSGYRKPIPDIKSNIELLEYGNIKMEVFFPGEGHTSDNIVVWFPIYKILFGGCLIKSGNSTDIGNIAEANVKQWPITLKNILIRYPDIEIVIPGHGQWGNKILIEHTIKLVESSK